MAGFQCLRNGIGLIVIFPADRFNPQPRFFLDITAVEVAGHRALAHARKLGDFLHRYFRHSVVFLYAFHHSITAA